MWMRFFFRTRQKFDRKKTDGMMNRGKRKNGRGKYKSDERSDRPRQREER